MIQLRDGFVLRALLGGGAACLFAACAIGVSGGFSVRIAGVLVRSHSVVPSATAAALLIAAAAAGGRGSVWSALAWWWGAIERRAAGAAVAIAAVSVAIALSWGTYVAGGSDSHCYLNQAELFARGQVRDFEPLAIDSSWPGTPEAFVPGGHTAVPGSAGVFVPVCPAGYSVALAAARTVGGRDAMFWVTPLMAGIVVWLAFVLARRIGGPRSGLLAAVFAASSPPFLFQAMTPMNDVTTTAAWCAVLVAANRAGGSPLSRSLLSGALAGCALAVRPNLLPLAAAVAMWLVMSNTPLRARSAVRTLAAFGVAILPGVLFVMAIQNAMHGSPVRSGYGDLSPLFSAAHVWPNLARYPRWLVEAHTPLILAALMSPLVARDPLTRRYCLWLITFSAAVFACYLPYVVFEDWWYLRFVLPAIPPLMALTAFVVCRAIDQFPFPARSIAFFAAAAVVAVLYVQFAARHGAFGLRDFEWRFRAAGEYVASRLPANAAFLTGHQTGSIRFYAARSTAGWGFIDPGGLDQAIEFLRRHGRKPYLLFEAWEVPDFRSRFHNDRLGDLEWPPMAEINRNVRIYDPEDYEKHRSGAFIATDRVIIKRR